MTWTKANHYDVPKTVYNSEAVNEPLVITATEKGLVLHPTEMCLFTYDQSVNPLKFRERLFALLNPSTYPVDVLRYFSYSDPKFGSIIKLHAFVGSLVGILRDLDIAEIHQPLLVQAQRTLVSGYDQETDHLFVIDTSENSGIIRTLLTYRDVVIKAIKRPHYNSKSLELIIKCTSSDYGYVSDFRKMMYDSLTSIQAATAVQAVTIEELVEALVVVIDRSTRGMCDTPVLKYEVNLMFRKLNWDCSVKCISMPSPQITEAGTELFFGFTS